MRGIIIFAPGRNGGTGRRSGLKIRRWQHHESSSLSSGTRAVAKDWRLGAILAGQWEVPGVGFLWLKAHWGRGHGEGSDQGSAFREKYGDGGRRPVDRPRNSRAGGARTGRARGDRRLRPSGRRGGL